MNEGSELQTEADLRLREEIARLAGLVRTAEAQGVEKSVIYDEIFDAIQKCAPNLTLAREVMSKIASEIASGGRG